MALDIFTESTLKKILEKVQLQNAYLTAIAGATPGSVTIDSLESIQEIVASGLASKIFAIGDQIIVPYTATNGTSYEMPWNIVHFGDVELEDGSTVPGMFIQSHYATIESIQFDATENEAATEETAADGYYYYGYDGSTYTLLDLATGDSIPYDEYTTVYHSAIKDSTCNIVRYGYNRWSHSAQRQWLNSSAEKGEWWSAQHLGDVAPSQLSTYKGFMAGFEDDFLNVLGKVKVTTALNTVTDSDIGTQEDTYDTFFLPSVEQMYGAPQLSGVEGDYFEYWQEATGLSAPSNDVNSGRITYALDAQTTAQVVRLRSAYRGYSYYTWDVYTAGYIYYYSAGGTFRCAPACVICKSE
ncbi:MAG: DUF6273 domain-containing protein [Lachnospiraceae bacterium]|nr:DUF6273 domain-containing protein [Lachnospiraceae bacterium]